jgi:hypothetical protein
VNPALECASAPKLKTDTKAQKNEKFAPRFFLKSLIRGLAQVDFERLNLSEWSPGRQLFPQYRVTHFLSIDHVR